MLGIIVGNVSFQTAINEKSQQHLRFVWETVNTILVGTLFVLVGLEVLLIKLSTTSVIIMSFLAIVFVLVSRYISILISGYILNIQSRFNFVLRHKLTALFTWTGLRGALAVALVMSLPPGKIRDLFLPMTYAVVVFSILIQGSTIKYLFSKQTLKEIVAPSK